MISDYFKSTLENGPADYVTGIYCNYKELHKQSLFELLANVTANLYLRTWHFQ